MDPKTLEQNKEIGALMQEFVGRTVDFYNDLPSQPVCRPASQEALERLQRQPIPAAGDRRAVPPIRPLDARGRGFWRVGPAF
ncbi:MAG TPA: hypothetical protein H9666_08260 [Firmicutes bacterium]|nr:hypothetical protein [Bacillota bacterium]